MWLMTHAALSSLSERLRLLQPFVADSLWYFWARRLGRVARGFAETLGRRVPALVLFQFAHLLVHTFGEWACVPPPLILHLDFHEDAVDVLPEALAIDPLLNISDPVLLLLGVVVMLHLDSCCSH